MCWQFGLQILQCLICIRGIHDDVQRGREEEGKRERKRGREWKGVEEGYFHSRFERLIELGHVEDDELYCSPFLFLPLLADGCRRRGAVIGGLRTNGLHQCSHVVVLVSRNPFIYIYEKKYKQKEQTKNKELKVKGKERKGKWRKKDYFEIGIP